MNYQSLYELLLDRMARDDVSKTVYNSFLETIESEVKTNIDLNKLYTVATLPIANGGILLPADFKHGVVVKVGDSVLTYMAPEAFERNRDNGGSFTIKAGFMALSGNVSETEATIEYYAKLLPLSETVQDNRVIREYPNIYLYGALWQGYDYIQDEAKAGKYEVLFKEALEKAEYASSHEEHSGSQLVMQGDNTLYWGQ